jgi:hypothetical protein
MQTGFFDFCGRVYCLNPVEQNVEAAHRGRPSYRQTSPPRLETLFPDSGLRNLSVEQDLKVSTHFRGWD